MILRTPLAIPSGLLLVALVALFAETGCTVLLDHSADQCTTNSDCDNFPGHLVCRAGLCASADAAVASDCFSGTPSTPAQFENQCTTATCLAFDNCARLGDCDGGLDDAALTTPPVPDSGSSTTTDPDASTPDYESCIDPDAGRANVVVITGSSNFPTTLALVAPFVIDAGYVPIFQTTNSCTGVEAIFDASSGTIKDPAPGPSAKYATYYNSDGTSVPCLLGDGGASVDIGESDIFSATCGAGSAPPGVGEWLGPVEAMIFAVPGGSDQNAITSTAARLVFGLGGDNGRATPWIDPTQYFVRTASTGTQQMIGHAIGVPAGQFWGNAEATATTLASTLEAADVADENSAIGLLSVDVYDPLRSNLKALAFRSDDQDCAYLPDSTLYTRDKQNIRDGHYPIWGPIHFFANTLNGSPATPQSDAFIGAVAPPKLSQDLVAALVASSLVPDCAMQVSRTEELGPLASYSPPSLCTCFFLSQVSTTVPSTCTTCVQDDDCTDPTLPACNYGYCEAQ